MSDIGINSVTNTNDSGGGVNTSTIDLRDLGNEALLIIIYRQMKVVRPIEVTDIDLIKEDISWLAEDVIKIDSAIEKSLEQADEKFCSIMRCLDGTTECIGNLNEAVGLITSILHRQDNEISKLRKWATGSTICILLLAIAIILKSIF